MKKLIMSLLINMCFSVTSLYADYDLKRYFPLNQKNIYVYSLTERISEQEFIMEGIVSTVEVMLFGGEEKGVKGVTRMRERNSRGNWEDYLLIDDSEGIKVNKFLEDEGDYGVFNPPVLLFPAKIKEGERVEYSGTVVCFDSAGKKTLAAKLKREFSCRGLEDIRTKAGIFKDCLRLSVKEVLDKDDGEREETYYVSWLSLGLGKVKEVRNTRNLRLSGTKYEELLSEEGVMELERATVNGEKFGN